MQDFRNNTATVVVIGQQLAGATVFGNTMWALDCRFVGGNVRTITTAPDSHAGLEAQNIHDGDVVTIHLDKSGFIDHIAREGN